MRTRWLLWMALCAACGPVVVEPPAGQQAAADAGVVTLEDAQIVQVMLTYHDLVADMAEVGGVKGSDLELLQMALELANDHRRAEDAWRTRADALGLQPVDSTVHQEVLQEGLRYLQRITSEPGGRQFDLAFFRAQIGMHAMIIHLMDRQLLSQVDATSLLELLEAQRAQEETHRSRAEALQEDLEDAVTDDVPQ